jgi:predicted GIY-YIG superfamily endonuclease
MEKYYSWTILEVLEKKRKNKIMVKAQCDCGKIKLVEFITIKTGKSKKCHSSCGLIRPEFSVELVIEKYKELRNKHLTAKYFRRGDIIIRKILKDNNIKLDVDCETRKCKTCKVEKNISFYTSYIKKGVEKRYYSWLCNDCKNIIRRKKRKCKRVSDYIRWNNDLIKDEALKYNTRLDFSKNSPGAYYRARVNKILDKVCSHMAPVGNFYKRIVYAYEFEDNHVYVGLTCNMKRRHYEHLYKNKSSVSKHIKKTNILPNYKIISNSYISKEDSQILEKQTLDDYIKKGWISLNKKPAGGLGGNICFWTEELLREESLKYNTRKEMIEKSKSAYIVICKRKLFHLFSHMQWVRKINYTILECVEAARNYNTIKEFKKDYKKMYGWICRTKLNNIVFSHMKRIKMWTP